MNQLNAIDILNCDDTKRERVNVPEWKGFVYVSVMSAAARDEYEVSMISDERAADGSAIMDRDNMRAKLVVATVTDESGNRLFTTEQAAELGQKSCAPIMRLYEIASRINVLTDPEIEEAAKN